jgi:subtilisin family serine protease
MGFDPAATPPSRWWSSSTCATVKADAARRSFDATGRGITWAVLDSGIDADHHHSRRYQNLKGDVASLHRDFTKPGEPALGDALVDQFGHGTHVAGIIAGGLPARMPRGSTLRVVERVFDPAHPTPRGSRTARSAGPRCWQGSPGRPGWSGSRCWTTAATASP